MLIVVVAAEALRVDHRPHGADEARGRVCPVSIVFFALRVPLLCHDHQVYPSKEGEQMDSDKEDDQVSVSVPKVRVIALSGHLSSACTRPLFNEYGKSLDSCPPHRTTN